MIGALGVLLLIVGIVMHLHRRDAERGVLTESREMDLSGASTEELIEAVDVKESDILHMRDGLMAKGYGSARATELASQIIYNLQRAAREELIKRAVRW